MESLPIFSAAETLPWRESAKFTFPFRHFRKHDVDYCFHITPLELNSIGVRLGEVSPLKASIAHAMVTPDDIVSIPISLQILFALHTAARSSDPISAP